MQNKHQLEWARGIIAQYNELGLSVDSIYQIAQAIIADAEQPSKISRLEVIDSTGRILTRHNTSVELSYQDQGKTIKIFLRDQKNETM